MDLRPPIFFALFVADTFVTKPAKKNSEVPECFFMIFYTEIVYVNSTTNLFLEEIVK